MAARRAHSWRAKAIGGLQRIDRDHKIKKAEKHLARVRALHDAFELGS